MVSSHRTCNFFFFFQETFRSFYFRRLIDNNNPEKDISRFLTHWIFTKFLCFGVSDTRKASCSDKLGCDAAFKILQFNFPTLATNFTLACLTGQCYLYLRLVNDFHRFSYFFLTLNSDSRQFMACDKRSESNDCPWMTTEMSIKEISLSWVVLFWQWWKWKLIFLEKLTRHFANMTSHIDMNSI